MNTKNYKYNELEYARLIYNKGFQTKHIPTELRLLVLYYKEVLKLKPKQRMEMIYDYCEKNMPDYKRAKYFKMINKALNQANKNEQKLITVENIKIYQGELDYINSLDIEYNFKKVLFTFLVQMKLNKVVYEYKNEKPYNSRYFKGGSIKYNNIKNMANLENNISINDDIIYYLNQYKLVTILHKGLIELNYLEYCKEDGDVIIEVKNYDNIGWYFDYYNNLPKMNLCKHCHQPFKQTRSNIEYCSLHKGYQPIKIKKIICVDCGNEFDVDSKNTHSVRCEKCVLQHKKKLKKLEMQRYRQRKNNL